MTQRAAILTDSSAGMPSDDVARLGIAVVPIHLTIGSQEYRDGHDLNPGDLYAALEQGTPVKSAAPSPLDYLDAIEESGSEHVVVITPATEFTWMHRNATLAAELATRGVSVVDSRSATAGHGLVVLAAAKAAEAGGSVDDVVSAADDAATRVDLVGALETLDYLRASGRMPALAVGLATQLGVRPVFRFEEGVAERVGLPRTEEGALARMVKEWRARGGEDAEACAVFHAARPDGADELARRIGGASFATEFSAAMAIHTGPGVVGVAWLKRREGEPEL
ncbi:MAG TPA: DegV family protein [Actinomycetota bacterium]|nr:DegV family protein [Actinomycetota bacterium]